MFFFFSVVHFAILFFFHYEYFNFSHFLTFQVSDDSEGERENRNVYYDDDDEKDDIKMYEIGRAHV